MGGSQSEDQWDRANRLLAHGSPTLQATDDIDREVVLAALEWVDYEINRIAASNSQWAALDTPSLPVTMTRESTRIRRHQLDDQVRALESKQKDAERQVNHLKATVEGFTLPPEIPRLFRALAGFEVLGMVFPLIVMAWSPVPDQLGVRIALVAAFLIGLAWCFRVLWNMGKALSDPNN